MDRHDEAETIKPTPACVEPAVKLCVDANCSCVGGTLHNINGYPTKPAVHCMVAVRYDPWHPELPSMQMSGECAMNAEIALAVALSALIKASAPILK